jgi:hypothetical protein
LPPEFLGWVFGVLGSLLLVFGIRALQKNQQPGGGDLYPHLWPISRTSQALLVRTCDRLHPMFVRSIQDISRSLYDGCTFAPVDEGII